MRKCDIEIGRKLNSREWNHRKEEKKLHTQTEKITQKKSWRSGNETTIEISHADDIGRWRVSVANKDEQSLPMVHFPMSRPCDCVGVRHIIWFFQSRRPVSLQSMAASDEKMEKVPVYVLP
jgi:hypothetical protein